MEESKETAVNKILLKRSDLFYMSTPFDITPHFQRFVVNRLLPLESVFDFLGVDYNNQGNMLCPFHDDVEHPSGKMFTDEDGVSSLWCFAEQKRFFSSNAVTELAHKPIPPIFERLWAGISEVDKENLFTAYGKPIDVLPKNWVYAKDRLKPFVHGALSYDAYLTTFLKIVVGDDNFI